MIIDLTKLDKSAVPAIKAIETKSHVRYIRYLLTKRIPPDSIRKELARLALSSPERSTLVTYFKLIMLPIVEKYGLEKYYEEYIERLDSAKHEQTVSPVLNFDVSFEDDDASRFAFCKLVRELEVEEMWSREITRYYGGVQNIPKDAEGNRIIKANVTRSVENILTCPRKYIIDKLLLESVAVPRICTYMKEKYQIKIQENDLYSYAKYFFNFERRSLEGIIEQLLAEQNSIKSDLEILNSSDNYSLGDKLAIAKQYGERLAFLDESIKELNARYSDLSYKQGIQEEMTIHEIVSDIVKRGYDRLTFLDRYKDRDVVKPLTEVAKMVFSAIDKLGQLEEAETKRKAAVDKDKSAQEVIIEMYQESYEKHVNEAKEKFGEAPEETEIEGIEEV